VKFLFLSALNC